jgi:hypothetical protein
VVIPTWNEGPRKTMEPVRTEPAPLVASKLSAGQMGGNPCGQSGDVINECSKTPQTCPVGQSLVSGQCVVPTISCIAPAVLVQGSCVSPNTNAGNNITNAPAPNQTRPAPVAPTTVRIAPAPAPVRPVPAPPTTASESPEPANPIIVTREQRDGYAIVKMTNVSPRINWNVAMNIFNCVNVKSPATSCGRHVFIATLGPQGGFANNIIDAENKSMEFSYEISVDWGKSAY